MVHTSLTAVKILFSLAVFLEPIVELGRASARGKKPSAR